MEDCHNTIDKILDQLSGKEVILYTSVELVRDPIHKEYPMILTHLKTKCKICGQEYSYLVKSCFVE